MLLETGFPLSVQRKEEYYKNPHPTQCIKYGDFVPEITEEELEHYESALRLLEVDDIDRT